LAQPGAALRWQPVWSEAGGDLGYTTGRWQLHARGPDGKEAKIETGTYVTVWRRQDDGRWKIAFDLGTDDK
jgi:ketosteroid isomerase-like protein